MNICQLLRNRASDGPGNVAKRRSKKLKTQSHLSKLSEAKLIAKQRAFSAELPSTTRSTYAITFSADKKYAAASTGDHNIHVIDVNSGKIVKTLKGKKYLVKKHLTPTTPK